MVSVGGSPSLRWAPRCRDQRDPRKVEAPLGPKWGGCFQRAVPEVLRGGREEVPVAQQQFYLQVLEEPDPERQLRLNARNSREGKLRIGSVAEVIRSAAPLDPDIAALWERINTEYRANQRTIVQSLGDKAALSPELDIERATDLLWTLNHPSTWQLLVVRCGWTPEQYEQWVAETACAQLLRPPRGRRRPRATESGSGARRR